MPYQYLKSGKCISKHLTSVLGKTNDFGKSFHLSTTHYVSLAALKLPMNIVDINAAETGRFSPLRERDISGPVINSCYKNQNKHSVYNSPAIDITVQSDPHSGKYDCLGAVSLSSSMQSNVPSPFVGNNTHLNMPGSQWGQGYKYLSDHLNDSHYLTLRDRYRQQVFSNAVLPGKRNMCTSAKQTESAASVQPETYKEKLKKAVKEYGTTVIVFHVSISLMSLGSCYLLVSSGIDVLSIMNYFNLSEGTISKVAASNAGTFVIAYTVHKLFAPVRMGITLTATPFIVRYLRKKGFLKKSPSMGDGK